MNVGFYYHVGKVSDEGAVLAPSYLARFVEELARQAGTLTFFAHTDPATSSDDTHMSPSLVRGVPLGPRRSAPSRTFLPQPALRHFDPRREGVDVMLIRGPSPLLPHVARAANCPVALLLVGDYPGWRRSRVFPWWRNLAVAAWVQVYRSQQLRAGRHALVLTNSPSLARAAQGSSACVWEVFTSSLTKRDLEWIPEEVSGWGADKGATEPVRMLFAGRLAEEKGLLEAVEALALLRQRGRNVVLELVGWSDDSGFIELLAEHARRHGVADHLVQRGYRRAGPELLATYLDADIFIMPSRARSDRQGRLTTFEGFPRAIIEALAMGRPVVASRVGGIADRLTEGRTALLVKPDAPDELANAVERLLDDPVLRGRLVREGRAWAKGLTNERSCALILDHLRAWVAKCRVATAQTSKRAS